MTKTKTLKAVRETLLAGTLAFGMMGAVTAQLVLMQSPAFAEPVSVDAPAPVSFAPVVEKVKPAVVSVQVKSEIKAASNQQFGFGLDQFPGFRDLPEDHPFNRFFRRFGEQERQGERQQRERQPRKPRFAQSQGSGFFISEDGYVVTNNHVIENGSAVSITMDDGTELDAKVIGTDPRTDLALLKVDGGDRKFTYVAFAKGDSRVGDWVVAVGNPFGLGGTVTAGIISARGRDIGAGPYDDFIQIDAPVNKGNSGGPAFNSRGEVIGVNTAIFSPSGGNVGIAFAIPASTAETIISDLRDDGLVSRGWLGVQIQPITEDLADSLGLAGTEGALVADPTSGGPAEEAGIQAGDAITAVDGKSVKSTKDLSRRIAAYAPGSKVEVTLMRDGREQTITVELGNFPTSDRLAARSIPKPAVKKALEEFGMTVEPTEDGVGMMVTAVKPNGAAAEKGIAKGDVIFQIGREKVNTLKEIEAALEAEKERGRKKVLFGVKKANGGSGFTALSIG
ncbi:Do family serine endopeptidase [Coralliovum pocilloporae]|uniref:Do family serine endopeptidase n=1 Tax=Coralliovum pocilloporae TaxID=3066369 RepID=UPI00330739BD